ncbi:MAG: leucine-rich repeat domain-containing protein [Clostridia bacterium]|nr:leucine-rich repeat domain-containing protein [Clostridia bacterium]
MRKIVISLCIIAVLVLSVPMFTACNDDTVKYDFSDTNFGYTYNSDAGETVTLTVLINKNLANAIIPTTVTNNGTTYTVTQIGEALFAPAPDGVTLNEVFSYNNSQDETNDKLITVLFEAGSQINTINGRAFERCKSLTSITLPDSVTTIKGFAFYKCISLTSFNIPASVTTIADYAFLGCTGLETVIISASDPNNLPSLGVDVFKWYDKSKVEFMGNEETYLLIDGLNIYVADNAMLTAFAECEFSKISTFRNWSDYKDIMSVEVA